VKPGENRVDFLSIFTVKMGMRPVWTPAQIFIWKIKGTPEKESFHQQV
jgi:hypothetical protein